MSGDSIKTSFDLDDKEGSVRIEYDPEAMFPDDSGTGKISISYGDIDIRVKSRDGRTPVLQFSSDEWGRCLDRVGPTESPIYRPIDDDAIDSIEKAADAVADELGYVEIELGPEASPACEEKVDEVLEYEIGHSPYCSRVIGPATDYEMFVDAVEAYDDRLTPVVESELIENGWDHVMPDTYT